MSPSRLGCLRRFYRLLELFIVIVVAIMPLLETSSMLCFGCLESFAEILIIVSSSDVICLRTFNRLLKVIIILAPVSDAFYMLRLPIILCNAELHSLLDQCLVLLICYIIKVVR